MYYLSRNSSFRRSFRMALVILLVILSAFSPWAAQSALAQGGSDGV